MAVLPVHFPRCGQIPPRTHKPHQCNPLKISGTPGLPAHSCSPAQGRVGEPGGEHSVCSAMADGEADWQATLAEAKGAVDAEMQAGNIAGAVAAAMDYAPLHSKDEDVKVRGVAANFRWCTAAGCTGRLLAERRPSTHSWCTRPWALCQTRRLARWPRL